MQVLERYQSQVIGIFRIVVGFLFACHGAASLFGVLGSKQAEAFVWPSWWAALIQMVGGALVAIGFGTRYAALLSSGSMAFAYFTVHQVDALLPVQNGGEKAALFCFAFLLIAFLGNGAWALGSSASFQQRQTAAVATE
ncbi:DoxX family protein [Kribbella antibiotica]|uniref:DoxX family protein n=1 Tax=Kribbella antibiotica TaxID=190195 RepID=A0A4R4ZNC7_9ACTN|nr:DoxX family protein [Kribbella antibiotica]TDD59239.1 DoxX family protein [Kribbella antibiotica]